MAERELITYERDEQGGLWCRFQDAEGGTCRNPYNSPCRVSYCEDGAREQGARVADPVAGCWACARPLPTRDVPEGDIGLCTRHWNWWVQHWLGSDSMPPCWAHLLEGQS